MLTVCSGSWLLAALGLLDGKKATSNKFLFNEIRVRLVSTAINHVSDAIKSFREQLIQFNG